MEFHDAKCPNCGGALQLPDNLKTAKCMYCGAEMVVKDAIHAAGVSVEGLMKRAAFAAEVDNHQEAYDYFTRVLEYEPQNYAALLGKAEAAGRLSPTSRLRAEELIKGAAEAVASAPDGMKGNVERLAAEMIARVCAAYSDLLSAEPESTTEQMGAVIDCLEVAHNYVPFHPQVLETLVAEYRELRWQAEIEKANNERTAIRTSVNTAPAITAALNNLIATCHRKRDEYLFKLNRVAPERAALQMERERQVEEQIRKIRVGGCAKAWGCWAASSFILLLAVGVLFSIST
jgi:hypothetical protein